MLYYLCMYIWITSLWKLFWFQVLFEKISYVVKNILFCHNCFIWSYVLFLFLFIIGKDMTLSWKLFHNKNSISVKHISIWYRTISILPFHSSTFVLFYAFYSLSFMVICNLYLISDLFSVIYKCGITLSGYFCLLQMIPFPIWYINQSAFHMTVQFNTIVRMYALHCLFASTRYHHCLWFHMSHRLSIYNLSLHPQMVGGDLKV